MKKRVGKNLLGVLYLVIGMLLIFPTQITKAETLPIPVAISDFKMNKHTVEPGDKMRYSFTLTETNLNEYVEKYGYIMDLSGLQYIYSVRIKWKSSKKQYVIHEYKWESNENKQIKVSGTIPIMKGMQSGIWVIDKIDLEVSGDGEIPIVNEKNYKQKYGHVSMNFSMADFTVIKTGKADNKAPTIDLKSLKLSKKYVKRNQKSTFQVKVKDATKIKKVECTWWLYEKSNRAWADSDWSKTYKMTYNKKKKVYQCSLKMDTKYYKKMILHCVTVQDIYGNEKYYSVNYRYIPKNKKKYYNAYKKMVIRKK